MRIRTAATAVLLAAVALGTTACDPDEATGDTAAPPAASAATPPAAGSPSAAKPSAGKSTTAAKSAAPTADGQKPDCKTYYASHKVIHATTVDKGFAKISGIPVSANCTENGVFFNDGSGTVSYPVSPDAKVKVFVTQELETKTVAVKSGTAGDGMAHVKTCAETPHITDFDKLPADYFCYQDMYELTLDSHGTITALTETWSS